MRHVADIGSRIGGEHLGGSGSRSPPAARPALHWEAAHEEWLIVLSGTPTVRTPAGEEVLAPGDVVCFPAGPDGPTRSATDGDEPCRMMMVSNRAAVNVVVYPDTGRSACAPLAGGDFLADAGVGYWDGE